MITASNDLKNIFKNNTSVKTEFGGTIEYNLNDMVNNITVTPSPSYATIGTYKPFTKIFPASSVVESNRPIKCGIKYVVLGDSATTNEFKDPKVIKYDKNFRTYIPGVDTRYKYYLSNRNSGLQLNVVYPKTIITNKIVVKFELAHSTPTSGSIVLKNGVSTVATINFTSGDIKAFGQLDAGSLTAYYTGSAWSFTEGNLNTSSTVSITEVVLSVPAVSGKKHIGVIEIAPKLVLDISSDIEDFNIDAEASSSISEAIPVGNITANSLSLRMNKYDKSTLKIITYDKASTTFESNKLYMYKNANIKIYVKVYHANGALGSSPNKYDLINQGIFYINNWKISEFGDLEIFALDGAKVLQDTICPDILCQQYSGTAIIRNLLDSIGFTNYEINLGSDQTELGVISPRFWWTEDNTTVWEALQDICIDSQMIALFDHQNVLKFYSRNYIYNSARSEDWTMYYSQSSPSDPLPNIISLDKQDLPIGNKIRILWQGISTSRYELDAAPLYKSPTTFLTAASVSSDILLADTAGSYMSLIPVTEDGYEIQDWFYSYSGYVLIDSEIIEYDAVRFMYKDEATGLWKEEDITDASDILKYRSYAIPGIDNFKSTGKYRIKTRGAFNTTPANHYVLPKNTVLSWSANNVKWI